MLIGFISDGSKRGRSPQCDRGPLYRKSVSRRLASLGEKVLSFASKFVFCGQLLVSNHDKTVGK